MATPSPVDPRPMPGAPRLGAAGRGAKLLPPADPPGTLSRPELERRLAAGVTRRLTVVVAGAGFGKSTLVAHLAAGMPSAWYTLDGSDRHLGHVRGRDRGGASTVPARPSRATSPPRSRAPSRRPARPRSWPGRRPPRRSSPTSSRTTSPATCSSSSTTSTPSTTARPHGASSRPSSGWRRPSCICSSPRAPSCRSVSSGCADRARCSMWAGRACRSAPRRSRTSSVSSLPTRRWTRPRSRTSPAASMRRPMAGPPRSGWPWRPIGCPAERRRQTLERLQHPDGPLFGYLAEEVVARASEATRDLIARAVHFDRFSAPLCVAIGSPDAEAMLARMSRRALFLQSHPAGDGWYALHGLVREFTLARLPLPEAEVRAVQARAADWFEGQGLLEAALDARLLADDPAAPRPLPVRARRDPRPRRRDPQGHRCHGPRPAGRPDRAPGAGDRRGVPRARRVARRVRLVRPGGRQARPPRRRHGLADGAHPRPARCLRRGARDLLRRPSSMARSRPTRRCSTRGSPRPTTTAAMSRPAARPRSERWLARRRPATSGRSRPPTRRSAMSHDLSHQPGLAPPGVRGSAGRGRAGRRHAPGRAHPHRRAASSSSRRAGSRTRSRCSTLRSAWPRRSGSPRSTRAPSSAVAGQSRASAGSRRRSPTSPPRGTSTSGSAHRRSPTRSRARASLHALRGDLFLARGAFERAVQASADAGDNSTLAPACMGLAGAIALDDPEQARGLVARGARARRRARRRSTCASAPRAWRSRSATGPRRPSTRPSSFGWPTSAATIPGWPPAWSCRPRRRDDPAEARRLVEAATAIWERVPAPVRRSRATGSSSPTSSAAPRDAPPRSRPRPCSARSAPAAAPRPPLPGSTSCDRAARPPLSIGSLGRFRVVRDGEVVPATAWQSKKARDLLKILVARRGRPDDARDVLRAALARRGPGAARQPAVGRPGDGPLRAGPGATVPAGVLRGRRQELPGARPRPRRAGHRALPRRRGRRIARRPGPAITRLPNASWRRPRRCTAATSSRRTRTRTGRSPPVRRPRRRTSASPGSWRRPPRTPATRTARPATTCGSSSATPTTRAPTSASSTRSARPAAMARRGAATGSTPRRWRRSPSRRRPIRAPRSRPVPRRRRSSPGPDEVVIRPAAYGGVRPGPMTTGVRWLPRGPGR